MMKTARIHGYGTTPAVEDAPIPAIGADQVLVRVAAAALNPLDVKIQQGFMHDYFPVAFPYTLGTDLSGTIESVGTNVTGWSQGDRVVARTDPPSGGAFADLAVVPANYLVTAPSAVSIEEAAGVPTVAGTAWQALFETAGLKAGQTVLVHAGAGGVGSFAIQLARNARARVIATASRDGIEIARQLGADQVIDYQAERFWDRMSDIDIVLDTIGGDTQAHSFDVLRAGGYLASTVAPPDKALAKAHNVTASFVFHSSDAARLAKLIAMINEGKLKVLVDRNVSIDQFGDAFAYQASGRARGKVLVTMT